jgi:UDP-glucose 4-epimerase
MKVLVTGGAGFIGSVVTEQLIAQGHTVSVFDSLIYGHRTAVHPAATFVQGDLLDAAALKTLLATEPFDAVAHLAAEAYIDESLRDPGQFYRANVIGGIHLLDAMVAAGVKKLVFSSTAAVYGQPRENPISEDASHTPCNSYGDSKLAFEHILNWYRVAHKIDYVCLRYFNACGATERCGEFRKKETHLIPICFEVALEQRPVLNLFGTDYDTPDGTCVRDYVHVEDIASAHLLALENLERVGARAYNLGNGEGYSNRQVVGAVSQVTERPIKVVDSPRRPGDPARLVASSARIRAELGWQPRYPDLTHMVETAWSWRQQHPQGYPQP